MHLVMTSRSSEPPSSSSPVLDIRSVKKEAPDDEIKEFAETAMNELLGWYGYAGRARGGRVPRGAEGGHGGSPPRPPRASPPRQEEPDECSWCNNSITAESNSLGQSMGDKFCSELCFSQSRRATFKRAKTCDWCRHIRHTVSYVDFQDGATQLQFCSDKCLNQYKMQIFCRETQAHLDLNPHLANAATSNTNLITPDLWMKNCKSRSNSPSSDRSVSPTAENIAPILHPTSPKVNVSISPPMTLSSASQLNSKSTMPVITVAPTSKLMKAKPPSLEDRIHVRTPESRREQRLMKVNSKKRRNSRCSSTVTSQTFQKHTPLSTITKPQDLRVRSPSNSHEGSPNSSSMLPPQNMIPSPPLNSRLPNMHPGNFGNPLLGFQSPLIPNPHNYHDPRLLRPPFYPPHNFMHRPPNIFSNEHMTPPAPNPLGQFGLGAPPPITVLVPYPVIIPIPLPIPIPIPIPEFVRAFQNKKWPTEHKPEKTEADDSNSEGPLDFTITQRPQSIEKPVNSVEDKIETEGTSNEINVSDTVVNNEFPTETETNESSNPEQTLPRFKITRLGSKMSKIVLPKTRELSESTRPLRKRRRLVDSPPEEDCTPVVSKTRKTVHA